jgi:hypothetical protein
MTLYLEPREMFDPCIARLQDGAVVYSADRIIIALLKSWGASEDDDDAYDEALDYFFYNIEGAYRGEFTPLYEWGDDD